MNKSEQKSFDKFKQILTDVTGKEYTDEVINENITSFKDLLVIVLKNKLKK
jgi:hypothetical protein